MGETDATDEETSAPIWVWVVLSLIATVSFWCQATVTEERFVPALNVISEVFHIPDDVAGATLMAAGASSPELFSSIVSLFITHSALGLGTIVGSEIFNQLCICAGAVYASRGGILKLNAAILTREVFFYGLSIGLLYYALHDVEPDANDPKEHIYISFGESCLLFGGYIAYVFVCAYMDSVVAVFKKLGRFIVRNKKDRVDPSGPSYGSLDNNNGQKSILVNMEGRIDSSMPYLRQVELNPREPVANFDGDANVVEYERTRTGQRASLHHQESSSSSSNNRSSSFLAQSIRDLVQTQTAYSDGANIRRMRFLVQTTKPSNEHALYEIKQSESDASFSCFMWQRSYFYNKARFAMHGWHLRWLTFTSEKMFSVPDRTNAERHRVTYPRFTQLEVDDKRLIIRIIHPDPKKRNVYLKAPSKTIFERVLARMEELAEHHEIENPDQEVQLPEFLIDDDPGSSERHAKESMIDFPIDGSNLEIVIFCLTFPLRLLMHWTVPDVRTTDKGGDPTASTSSAFLAIFGCLLWLVVGSYAMVASLEALADLMSISPEVVGVTVSAVGTSLPNYVASRVAAQNGFGNMAVSNAFGSNTFNILCGLGFPWLLYTSFATGFKPYHGLENEGVLESVIVLAVVLLIFVVIIISSRFTLYRWHAILFLLLYVAYLLYAIVPVYW